MWLHVVSAHAHCSAWTPPSFIHPKFLTCFICLSMAPPRSSDAPYVLPWALQRSSDPQMLHMSFHGLHKDPQMLHMFFYGLHQDPHMLHCSICLSMGSIKILRFSICLSMGSTEKLEEYLLCIVCKLKYSILAEFFRSTGAGQWAPATTIATIWPFFGQTIVACCHVAGPVLPLKSLNLFTISYVVAKMSRAQLWLIFFPSHSYNTITFGQNRWGSNYNFNKPNIVHFDRRTLF